MLTTKDILNSLPKAIIEDIDNSDFAEKENCNLYIIFEGTNYVYDTGISIRTVNKLGHIIKNILKYVPDNWADKIIALDNISKIPNLKYWVCDQELFRNIIKYVSKDEFQKLIYLMISNFGLLEGNQVKTALDNNDEAKFCDIMLNYEGNKRYRKFAIQCYSLILIRRIMLLDWHNAESIKEINEIQNIFFEIKQNSGDTQIIDLKEFMENPKIDKQEKLDYIKNDFIYGAEFINYLNFSQINDEMPQQIGLKNKFDLVLSYIEEAAKEYAEKHMTEESSITKSIERSPLYGQQLENLYEKLLQCGNIGIDTPKELFIRVFSGKDLATDERIVFKFKNQYSFKFLIQEMYGRTNKEIKETPPRGIEVGKPSDIFFFYKCGTQRPLKFQKENASECSNAARKEQKRIREIISTL